MFWVVVFVLILEVSLYRICRYETLLSNGEVCMKSCRNSEDVRWQVVKAMLDDFPALRKKVKNYVLKSENEQSR